MSTLLGRSNVSFEMSKDALSKVTMDDNYMDWACFHAHQSLELLLKHIIESNGMQSPKTHSIDDLLVYAKTSGFSYSDAEELSNLSYEINKWETTSRYGKGIKTTVNKVQVVYKHIDKIRDEFLSSSGFDKKFSSVCGIMNK